MDGHVLLDITRKELSARIGVEESINNVYKSAISSSNIDGRVIDECYETFGSEVSYFAMGLLKQFFESIEYKNSLLIADLKKEIKTITDTTISQSEKSDIEQLAGKLNMMVQDIVARAKDRRVYGNMDSFILTNLEHYIAMKRSGNVIIPLDIRGITQEFLLELLEGNETTVSDVVNNYVGELLAIIKNALLNKDQEGNVEEISSSMPSIEQSAAEFFAEDEETPQPSHPSM